MAASEDIVRWIATELKMLDADGQLMELDSLSMLDFVTAIEDCTGKTIPTTQIRRDTFESLATIIALVDQL